MGGSKRYSIHNLPSPRHEDAGTISSRLASRQVSNCSPFCSSHRVMKTCNAMILIVEVAAQKLQAFLKPRYGLYFSFRIR